LLAIAVLGVFMFNVFERTLTQKLDAAPIASETRTQLLQHSGALLNLKIPDGLNGETQAAIRQAIQQSFVAGFRVVAYLAAALAAASALASWLLIAGKTASP
jgi:hypothetical protein